ncbi:MAG: FHA domain-containing protein [Acidobacteriota bacterium]
MTSNNPQGNVPYLLGLVGALSGQDFPLNGGKILIGRDATQCQIVLSHAAISRCHAAIEQDGGGAILVDLGLRQSTFVNGEPITRRELRDGDQVGFGPGGLIAFSYHAGRVESRAQVITPNGPIKVALSAPAADALRSQLHADARLATTAGLKQAAPTGLSQPLVRQQPGAANLQMTAPLLRLGRASDNEIVIDAPGVSRYHATLTYQGDGQPVLADLGSTNGTFVNGELLTAPRLLAAQDLVFIGGFLLRVEGRQIKRHDLSASRITAWRITKEVPGRTLLKDISLALAPREFIGLMGPSGCGKSTLMDALNGLRPATSGAVYVNDLDLYRNFDALRRSIGYVPQRDILHDALSVERTLHFAARLRLPEGTSPAERQRVIDEVIETVGLGEHRQTAFRQLSGGQQKRLSLALELLTKPSFLFLDEPTSPLDPETTENMMLLFRRLADEGRIVVMVTHKFEKFDEMHQVAILTRGGRLAFFGPPREALNYFGCREPSDIYRVIGARDPDDLNRDFTASAHHQRYVTDRIAETQELLNSSGQVAMATAEIRKGERRAGLQQWLTLTQRYLEIKLKDKRNTALLLLQAPVIALILALITGDVLNDSKALFIAAIISIWFGANNAVREIVAEAPIYVRERLVNLKIPSYVFSKYAVLAGIALIQCLLFVMILVGLGRFSSGDIGWLTLILYLTSLGGVAMGLFFSALVNSTEKAMSILPLVLIPQLLLSGFLKPLDDYYVNLKASKPATAADYQRAEDAKNRPPANLGARRGAMPAIPDPVVKYEGLGAARYAADAMIARWAIEALVHAVSLDDLKARDLLATRMTVAEYASVLNGQSSSQISTAYRQRVLFDCAVLGGFSVIFLLLTMWMLKRKDVL